MNNNYVVYCHTTPSGKRYVGITRQTPEKRWMGGKGYTYNSHFDRAIKKYGWENIHHDVLFENLSQKDAAEWERILIEKYNTQNPRYGYNQTSGGDVGYQLTDVCKNKLSKAHKKINKDGRNSKRNIGKLNAMSKPIYQYTRHGGFVAEYGSVSDAARFFVLSGKAKSFETARRQIMNAANHRLLTVKGYKTTIQSAYGYKWDYSLIVPADRNVEIKKRNSQTRAISQYSKCGKYIRTYKSIKEAADTLGVAQAHITQSARGQRISAHGYLWAYADTENIEAFISNKAKEKMHGGKMWSGGNHRARAVVQYDFDGNYIQTYQSIADASRILGIGTSEISGCARNKIRTAGGFIWKYI